MPDFEGGYNMSGRFSPARNTLASMTCLPLLLMTTLALFISGLLPLSNPQEAKAWSSDPTVNTPICTAVYDQTSPAVISDGAGGVIIAWQDFRNFNWDIYAQRVDSSGTPLWTENGAAICTGSEFQAYPTIISDGSGGAIIAWQDSRNLEGYGDIYAQRVGATGATLWANNGVPLCTTPQHDGNHVMVGDGSGGAIIVWTTEIPAEYGVRAQKVNSSGVPQWTDNGVVICMSSIALYSFGVVGDVSGGALIAWSESRGSITGYDVYAQRVDSTGILLWTEGGTALCTAFGGQFNPSVVSDGSGGAIVAWRDQRHMNDDIYAQRVSYSGMPQWTHDGTLVDATPGGKVGHLPMVGDGSGGIIVMWQSRCSSTTGGNCEIYAQRVSSSGVPQWPDKGITVCTAVYDDLGLPQIASDGSGGFIIAWYCNSVIYVQRTDSGGRPQWSTGGMPVCTVAGAVGAHQYPALAGDGSGGAIVAWRDMRSSNVAFVGDIYAQRISAWGGRSGVGSPPNQPSNVSPVYGGTPASLTPTLQSSVFSDPDAGDTHASSQWRIRATTSDYSNPLYDSGTDSANLTELAVGSGILSDNATYYWQVRHQENDGAWSVWSTETSFTTGNRPSQPSSVSPADDAPAGLTPTLRSSDFSDLDTDDTHAASQWQIRVQGGSYSSPVFDSETDDQNLTSMKVEAGILEGRATYYWRVRYQDNHGDWSDWSEEVSFNAHVESGLTWVWVVAASAVLVAAIAGVAVWQTRHPKKGVST
jgi:hypothetical protein